MSIRFGEDGFLDAYCKAWHRGGDRLASFFAESATYYDLAFGVELSRDGLNDLVMSWGAFSPDSRMTFENLVGDDRRFCFEWRWTGSATGRLEARGTTLIGTGGHFDISGVSVCGLDPGRAITWHKDYFDARPILEQCKPLAGT
jgi:hypothetical protein